MGTAWYYFLEVMKFAWDHLIFINLLFSIVIIFFQRRDPKSVWAWLLVLYSLPIVGFIIYLFAGTDMHKRKMFKTKEVEDKINEAIRQQESSLRSNELQKAVPEIKEFEDLVMYNLDSSGAMLSSDNEIDVFTDGNEKFEQLIADMENASSFIYMQYYIIRNDVLFQRIVKVLKDKAAQGVEVRILTDGMGGRGIFRKMWRELNEAGIHTTVFFPAPLKKLHLRINYRNHRKIVVIDNKIGYVGGFNVGKEYLGMVPKFGYWRDTHLRIVGSAVVSLLVRFVLDWNYAAKENLFIRQDGRDIFQYNPEEFKGDCEVQIVSSGPDSKLQNIHNNYLRLIAKAKKSIYIQTPYFIPDESLLEALIIAAHSGIQVNIMIPCKPDHPFVYWATYSYMGDMIMAGANCYTYDNGFLHAKGLIVDGKAYCYGTANMDIRSFQLNFEVNAVVYDERAAREMVKIFEGDMKYSTKITKDMYHQRKLYIRIKEQMCRLLSPLL